MSYARHLVIIAIAGTVTFPGCKKDQPPHVDLGYEYFPVNLNHWVEYQVDSSAIIHLLNDTGAVTSVSGDTFNYPMRSQLVENFTDPEGRPGQRIVRSMKDSVGHWQPHDVWWQVRTTTTAEVSEENQRRIKLIFPPRENQYWNTNVLHPEDELELTIDEADVPWSVNGMSFDSTVLVTTNYFNNAVKTIVYRERYAKHVGLVQREVDSTTKQTGIKNYWYFKQTITGYGN